MTEIISVSTFEKDFDTDSVPSEYETFRAEEGIPVHSGLAVDDINDLATGKWARTTERGALINLYGMEGIVDPQLHELTPEGETMRRSWTAVHRMRCPRRGGRLRGWVR